MRRLWWMLAVRTSSHWMDGRHTSLASRATSMNERDGGGSAARTATVRLAGARRAVLHRWAPKAVSAQAMSAK